MCYLNHNYSLREYVKIKKKGNKCNHIVGNLFRNRNFAVFKNLFLHENNFLIKKSNSNVTFSYREI